MTRFIREFPITMGLLTAMIGVFVAMLLVFPGQASSGQAVYTFGGLLGVAIRQSPAQALRLVTSNLVHIGAAHLLTNAFSLWLVGQIAEQIWSRWVYLTVFTLSGVFGGLLTIVLEPAVLSAGASASIFGLFAAVALLGFLSPIPFLRHLGKNYQSVIALNLVLNVFMPDVNIWGHLGGAIGGALLALALPNRLPRQVMPPFRARLAGLIFILLSLGLLLLFYQR